MANGDALRPLIDWVASLPPADLAAELMPAFGPYGPKGGAALTPGSFENDHISRQDLENWLLHVHGYPELGFAQRSYGKLLHGPIREAVQLLEHAELVYVRYLGSEYDGVDHWAGWSATRLGLAALAGGKDAVRQRIKDRTGL